MHSLLLHWGPMQNRKYKSGRVGCWEGGGVELVGQMSFLILVFKFCVQEWLRFTFLEKWKENVPLVSLIPSYYSLLVTVTKLWSEIEIPANLTKFASYKGIILLMLYVYIMTTLRLLEMSWVITRVKTLPKIRLLLGGKGVNQGVENLSTYRPLYKKLCEYKKYCMIDV